MSESSYRSIIRSSSIIASAQVVNVLAGLVKMKFVAVLLGPIGVGVAGLYLSLMQTASFIVALGLNQVGSRQVAAAQANGGDREVGKIRRVLFWCTLSLAACGALLFLLGRGWIAVIVLAEPERAREVAWLALGLALYVVSGSQIALLTGLRKVKEIAYVKIASGFLGAIGGVFALWLWGEQGLVAMVLAPPVATFLVGRLLVFRLGPPRGSPLGVHDVWREGKVMVSLGVAFMLSGLITTFGHLAARTLVQRELGGVALGQFQAAWSIGVTYIGFVLGAMGTDYFPRLTAAIKDHSRAVQLVNEQTEVALVLCAPALLALLALAPWVIPLLYSGEFGPAVEVLRWLLVGNILKVMSWPLRFSVLATGAGKAFIFCDGVGTISLLLSLFILVPLFGVKAGGMAVLVLYTAYLPIVWWLARRAIGFRWSRIVKAQSVALLSAAAVVHLVAQYDELWGGVLGVVLAVVAGVSGAMHLSEKAGLTGKAKKFVELGEKVRLWLAKLR